MRVHHNQVILLSHLNSRNNTAKSFAFVKSDELYQTCQDPDKEAYIRDY